MTALASLSACFLLPSLLALPTEQEQIERVPSLLHTLQRLPMALWLESRTLNEAHEALHLLVLPVSLALFASIAPALCFVHAGLLVLSGRL